MTLGDQENGETSEKEVTLARDEGNRPGTVLDDLAKLKPVFEGGRYVKQGRFVTAGNASQLSDGAAAVLLMEAKTAEKRGLEPLGAYRGMAVAGCAPEEMGIGPVFAIPKLLERNGMRIRSDPSKAQQHILMAERAAAKIDNVAHDIALIPVNRVGILGAGTMGGGIAMNFLSVGIPVTIVERDQAPLDRGVATVRRD